MLTTIEDIKGIRDLSQNLKDGRITPYIVEVEDAYILPAIGAALYERLDTGEETDAILMDGGYYDRPTCDGTERDRCYGIRRAVAYFAYARVLKNNQINVTAFGVTQKQSNQSNPTGEDAITDAVTEARKMGYHYLKSCIRYLHRNEKQCQCSPTEASGHGGARLKMDIV